MPTEGLGRSHEEKGRFCKGLLRLAQYIGTFNMTSLKFKLQKYSSSDFFQDVKEQLKTGSYEFSLPMGSRFCA